MKIFVGRDNKCIGKYDGFIWSIKDEGIYEFISWYESGCDSNK